MKLALLQLNFTVGDLAGNAKKIIEAVKKAKDSGVDLCITSEMALLGYPARDLVLNKTFVKDCEKVLNSLALELKNYPAVLIGTIEPNKANKGKRLFNTASLIKSGKIVKSFHKSLLPTYDVFDEDRYFQSADSPGVFKFNDFKIGVTICEDVWNHTNLESVPRYRKDPLQKLAKDKVDLIVNLSASPFTLDKQKIRQEMFSRIAKTYKTPVAYVNQVGGNDDLVFDGRSCAFDKRGKLFAKAKPFDEDIIIVDIDENLGETALDTKSLEEECWQALVLGTRDYIKKCGFKEVLLGLSGGIDSALTAAIAKEAIGRENVLGVLMPSPYSSKGSIDDSLKLAKNLGIRTITLPIEKLMQEFANSLADSFKEYQSDLTEENIQSRIRGNLLMALSNKYKALLLTTGNKSELAVGYCTIYGDMSGGLAVISDVPKTLVYKIVDWFNKKSGDDIIPYEIIKKAPSAELRPNQTDQDSLPDYDILDKIIYLYIEQHQGQDEIIKKGFDKDTVIKVLKLIKSAEFKRRQAAPGIKITDRAFGTGWRMPIAYKLTS